MLEMQPATQPWVMVLCATCAWGLTFSFFWNLRKTAKEGFTYINRLHQIPCSRCAFFTGDYRLKCTVHPCKALTEEAIACGDFKSTARCPKLQIPITLRYRQKASCLQNRRE